MDDAARDVESPGSLRTGYSVGRSLLISARPRQWAKNLLIFVAPATGRVLLDADVFVRVVLTFVAFVLVASGGYMTNDIVDRDEDATHHRKRFRPIAAGDLPLRLAGSVAALLILGGIVVAYVVGGPGLLAVVAGYVLLTMAYTFFLRRVVLLDVAAIAAGFLLRAVAGGVAADVPLSSWFLIVATFGSLFVAVSKRQAEFVRLGKVRGDRRSSLSQYTEPYLRYIQYSSSTACITAYCLWAFEGAIVSPVASGLSIIPFVLGIFRYALLVEAGRGEVPEDLLLRDPALLAFAIAWVVIVSIGLLLS
jgi:decaprenyl-phosphate phosphoribosyltransferase